MSVEEYIEMFVSVLEKLIAMLREFFGKLNLGGTDAEKPADGGEAAGQVKA